MNALLESHILDEKGNSKMYLEMAEEFEAEGHSGEAAILRDIAREEELHAHYLKEIAERHLS